MKIDKGLAERFDGQLVSDVHVLLETDKRGERVQTAVHGTRHMGLKGRTQVNLLINQIPQIPEPQLY